MQSAKQSLANVCTGICRNKSILIMTCTERGFKKRVCYLQKDVPEVMSLDRGWYRLTPAVQDMDIIWNASTQSAYARNINKCQWCRCCVCGRTCSFYHFIHCEVEFEVWICGWQVYPGTLSCSRRAFYTDSWGGSYGPVTAFFRHGGWLETARYKSVLSLYIELLERLKFSFIF